ncbi:MAG: hybrid sensor histidine kinase/response regulator [Alphaproteobacteria bacterium 65-37]|nr:MAG: hybrid sensor histidine kinase/response regulator [Alphaproteobacteria bacterium 65-37]
MIGNAERPLRALVLAPRGRDAAVACSLIAQTDVSCAVFSTLGALVEALDDDVAFFLVTEEAIRATDLKPLALWFAAQPAWSDLPVLLVTNHGGGPERNPIASRWLETLGNVSFIERPFHPTTLVSVARAAVKGRHRQYEARSLLESLRDKELRLQQANDVLERRVEERTAQLQNAHDELVAQIAERERTEAKLRQMQKIESIGQLTGGVAHDFNNLLTAVIANLELLRKRVPAGPMNDQLIDGAMQGAQRGAALTQRLLAFARHQALEPKPVDLAELVQGMGNLLRRSTGPAVDMHFDLPSGLAAAHIDANQVELALLNLVVNSRDAMPDGGRVAISLDEVETGTVRDLAAGRYLRLSVSDSGTGMDALTLQKAVEPFFSTKEVGKGTGLGLSMIHGLAQQLKGALRLFSTPGHGTRAELWLPVADGVPMVVTSGLQEAASNEKRTAKLLFVDDDFLIGLATTDLLEDLGHTVIRASSGAEALDILRADEAIDLMITDYAMPGMTGLQLAEQARSMRPELPILLATGYADLPARASLELPRLNKPYQQRQLAEQIKALLG